MNSLIERCIDVVRPVQIPGKGRLFDRFTPTSGSRKARVWGRYEMDLELENVVHRQIFMGCFGREIALAVRALLPVGGTFLDVGAHIGYFTLLASTKVGSGKVLAVEPNPAAFDALQNHLDRNRVGNVHAERVALSDAPGELVLYTPPGDRARDYNVTVLPQPGWSRVAVPARTLDDRLAEWKVDRIDLMKMDVEGAEPKVLAGGAEALRRGVVRRLMVEVNGPRLTQAGSGPAALVQQLTELGFVPAVRKGSRAVPVDVATLDLHPEHEHDRLFAHRSAL